MTTYRLRSQLFIAALLIILALAGSILLFIRHTVNVEVERNIRDGTNRSVRAFETVQQQRESQLSRTAAMLAELPTLKALMSTEHAPTIQDGSETFWRLAGSDLFVLAKPNQEVMPPGGTTTADSTGFSCILLRLEPDKRNTSWVYSQSAIK